MSIGKKLCLIFAAIMTVVSAVLLFSCGSDPMTGVSERRGEYFSASDDAMTVTAVSGVREDPFAADGAVGTIKPYTLITVVPKSFDIDALYTYTAKTDKGEFGGALVVHPFAASYSAEFESETCTDFTVVVVCGGEAREYALTSCVPQGTVDYIGAIDAAQKALGIKERGGCEIRVRLMKNPITDDGLCWYVAFCYADGKQRCVLLDCLSVKVLAVRK